MNFIQLRADYRNTLYPIERYHGYSLKEVLKKYREKHGLKYARNVKFTQF